MYYFKINIQFLLLVYLHINQLKQLSNNKLTLLNNYFAIFFGCVLGHEKYEWYLLAVGWECLHVYIKLSNCLLTGCNIMVQNLTWKSATLFTIMVVYTFNTHTYKLSYLYCWRLFTCFITAHLKANKLDIFQKQGLGKVINFNSCQCTFDCGQSSAYHKQSIVKYWFK